MNERRRDRSDVRVEAVQKQLVHVAEEGGFDLLVVADDRGGILGGGGPGKSHDPVKVAAFGGHLGDARRLLETHMDIHDCDELVVNRRFDRRLVCRYFDHRGARLTLIGMASEASTDWGLLDKVVEGVKRILEARDLVRD